MTDSRLAFVALVALEMLTGPLPAAEWAIPNRAPLLTPWARDVSPTNALPEYPRPQMVRQQWMNLNGLWQYAVTAKGAAQPQRFDEQILVPYPIESALSGVMKPLQPDQWLRYRRAFALPAEWNGQCILLHFGAVDWETAVFVNGNEVGKHRGGYDPFCYDITPYLKRSGPQEVVVRVFDDTNGAQHPVGKQSAKPGGMWYTRTSGIWQTVWLEPVPATRIVSLKMTPDFDHSQLRLTVSAEGATAGVSVAATATDGAGAVAVATAAPNAELSITVPNPRVWSPEDPFLYDLRVSLIQGNTTVDSVTSYFGLRKIEIVNGDGFQQIRLNGKRLIQMGLLDQGYWPDGNLTAPTDEALKWDVLQQRDLGCNLIRKHVKVEPARWYYWTDRLGMLVWQDMPTRTNPPDASCNAQFELELERMVATLYNHPSIVTWVNFNENWGHYDAERIARTVKRWDPTRLVTYDSGSFNAPAGDLNDIHNYPLPSYPGPKHKPRILGEHGVGELGIRGHTWTAAHSSPYLRNTSDLQSLCESFADLTRSYVVAEGLQASVYTQLTDVEDEQNGLWTYDRRVCKVDRRAVRAANQAIIHPWGSWYYTRIVDTSYRFDAGLHGWKYVTDTPPTGWEKPGFSEASWKIGTGAFGNFSDRVHTKWESPDIWLRKTFTFAPSQKPSNCRLHVRHHGSAEYYINGVLAYSGSGDNQIYRVVEIRQEAQDALRHGEDNVLAIHARSPQGDHYVDGGILYVNPPTGRPK